MLIKNGVAVNMFKYVGDKWSPSYHHAVLASWARRTDLDIGRRHYVGYALYVWFAEDENPVFVVEGRGPGNVNIKMEYKFNRRRNAKKAESRKTAFEAALVCYLELVQQKKLGDADAQRNCYDAQKARSN